MKKTGLIVVGLAFFATCLYAANSINRLQIVIRDGKTYIDYTAVDGNGKQIADGTVDNFKSTTTATLVAECQSRILGLLDATPQVNFDATLPPQTVIVVTTITVVKFASDTK